MGFFFKRCTPLLIIALLAPLTGCIQSLAVSTVGGLVDNGFEAYTEEGDLQFAAQALPGSIKLLEVFLKNDPENKRLLRLASEGYSSYALAFLEDDQPERAREFYLRGKEYGMRILRQNPDMAKALDGPVEGLKEYLSRRGKDDVPGAFWTAFGWGSYVSLSMSSPEAIADLPQIEALMEFVASQDTSYYYGGADVFLGTLAATKPVILGGNPVRSREHFDRALRQAGGRFLMSYVYYARSYAVQTQDTTLFAQLLTTVDQASLDALPEARLANTVAKKKAQLLLARKNDLF